MARRTLLAVGAVGLLVLSACTRPEDARPATSADSSIAPVTDTDPDTDTDSEDETTETADSSDTDGDGETSEATETTESGEVTATAEAAASSTAAPTTTVDDVSARSVPSDPPGTTAAPTTTTAPDDPSDLTLIFDGILPYRFGDRDVIVVPALTELLGPPALDELREYPDANEGMFYDASGEESFIARFGRTVCFANGLCVQFGAGAPETLIFTGWRIEETSEISTDDGIAIGSTLAEFADTITFDPAMSCYQVAYGMASGIDITLISDDGVFAAPNADGDGLDIGDPDPTRVTVREMTAGQLPVYVFADC